MQNTSVQIVTRLTCPHCWQSIAPHEICWIAAHPDLVNDPRLGPNEAQRFVPSRFNAEGLALDAKGLVCQELACPNCHLRLPRAVLDHKPFFVSIAGAPGCGKSFLLAAMSWQLRRELPRIFQLDFSDADPEANRILGDYEQQLFVNAKPDQPVRLAKTQEEGDWYNQVLFGEQAVVYPQPFLFSVKPGPAHPSGKEPLKHARLLCMYDNAGESFQPGKDTVKSAVTRHLGSAHAWIFCYDPTQDPRFRTACAGLSSDPQIVDGQVTSRQETLFHEMLSRIRKHGQQTNSARTNRPLVIACTKFDAWSRLAFPGPLPVPTRMSANHQIGVFQPAVLQVVSQQVEKLLNRFTQELVSAARSFSTRVWFLPISATGAEPVRSESGMTGFRPRDLQPLWCEYPVLLALAESTRGLVPVEGNGRSRQVH